MSGFHHHQSKDSLSHLLSSAHTFDPIHFRGLLFSLILKIVPFDTKKSNPAKNAFYDKYFPFIIYFFENHSSPNFPQWCALWFPPGSNFSLFFAIVYPSLWHHNRLRLMIMFACKCCLILVFSKSTFINRHTKESLWTGSPH